MVLLEAMEKRLTEATKRLAPLRKFRQAGVVESWSRGAGWLMITGDYMID